MSRAGDPNGQLVIFPLNLAVGNDFKQFRMQRPAVKPVHQIANPRSKRRNAHGRFPPRGAISNSRWIIGRLKGCHNGFSDRWNGLQRRRQGRWRKVRGIPFGQEKGENQVGPPLSTTSVSRYCDVQSDRPNCRLQAPTRPMNAIYLAAMLSISIWTRVSSPARTVIRLATNFPPTSALRS